MRQVRDTEQLVTLRLPKELHAKLKATGGERGLTDQVRRRLQTSFELDMTVSPGAGVRDPKLRDFVGTVGRAAAALAEVYEPSCQFFWEALGEALAKIIEVNRAKAEPRAKATAEGDVLLGSTHSKEAAVAWALAGSRK
jgi:hypothetical protein